MIENGTPKTQEAPPQPTQEIALVQPFTLIPTNLDQAMKYAELIAKSALVPDCFRGKAGDILIAIQMGMEVGLKPLQALQNIAVINGRPTIWGDAVLALVQGSGTVEWFMETWDESTQTATCKARRKGGAFDGVRTFSMKDADRAGLTKKQGTWQSYPKRMCQMRARAFALRDGWADVLKGIRIAEEEQDVSPAAAQKSENPFNPKPVAEAEIVNEVLGTEPSTVAQTEQEQKWFSFWVAKVSRQADEEKKPTGKYLLQSRENTTYVTRTQQIAKDAIKAMQCASAVEARMDDAGEIVELALVGDAIEQ